jgi:hypothetical protein
MAEFIYIFQDTRNHFWFFLNIRNVIGLTLVAGDIFLSWVPILIYLVHLLNSLYFWVKYICFLVIPVGFLFFEDFDFFQEIFLDFCFLSLFIYEVAFLVFLFFLFLFFFSLKSIFLFWNSCNQLLFNSLGRNSF